MERKRFEPAQFYQKNERTSLRSLFFIACNLLLVYCLQFAACLLLVICRLRCSDAKARFFFLAAIPGCGDCFGVAYRIKAANKHEKVVAGFYNGAAG